MDILAAVFDQVVGEMTEIQRKAALDRLVRIVDADLVGDRSDRDRDVCPRCGCPHTSRNGHQNGYQRRICKGCGRSFSPRTLNILSETKLPRDTWVRYVRLMIDGKTMRECARDCGVSLKTSFFMRHRICEMMEADLDAFRVDSGCSAEIDEFYLHESFTGNHGNGGLSLPRKAHKRGGDVHTRGISNELIGILTGVNDHGDCFCELVCRGRMSKKDAHRALSGKVMAGSIVSTDKHHSYVEVLEELGVLEHNAYDSKEHANGTINSVNSLHSRLASFLRPFHCVSSRRLSNYLIWFQWLESFKKLESDTMRKNLAIKHMGTGSYRTAWREYRDTPYPFGDYYGWAV